MTKISESSGKWVGYYHLEGTEVLMLLAYDSQVSASTHFCQRGQLQKYLEQAISNRLAFMSLKKIMKLVFLLSSSMISNRPWGLIAQKQVYGHPEKQLKLLAFTGTKEEQPRPILLTIFWTKSPTSYAVYHEYDTGW